MNQKFQCLLMGDRNLLTQCGELLLNRGHKIVAVCTSDMGIGLWAKKRGFPVMAPSAKNFRKMKSLCFDYFFSVANLRVVPEDILALPKRGAINFHDGPLPYYRGLFTPVWALLNEEQRYGITWHLMTAQVDCGHILKTKAINIRPAETSLSLNTKCFEAAIESFEELIDDLSSGTIAPQSQPDHDSGNFGKYDRPEAACTLNWQQSAKKLDAMVRALDFGTYENGFTSAKVLVDDKLFLVADSHIEAGTDAAGQIVSLDSGGVKIATSQGTLCLNSWKTPFGNPVSWSQLETGFGLRKGARLPILDPVAARRLTTQQSQTLRWEAFWVRRLVNFKPMEPCLGKKSATLQNEQVRQPIRVPQIFKDGCGSDSWASLVAGFAAFTGKWTGKSHFHLGYSSSQQRRQHTGLESWFAGQVPLAMDLESAPRWAHLTEACKKELARVDKRGTWFLDVVARYPRLGHLRPLEGRLFPLAVATESTTLPFKLEPGNQAALVFDEETKQCSLAYNAQLEAEEMVHWCKRFEGFLQQLSESREASILGLDVLNPKERQELVLDWNKTALGFQEERGFPCEIQQQAHRTPDAIALVSNGRTITYARLLEESSIVAGKLQKKGIGPDQLVAIHLTRKPNLLIAVLGVGLAGGAYLPLDPAYPRERIQFMLRDSGVSVVITEKGLDGIPEDFRSGCMGLNDPPSEGSRVTEAPLAAVPSQHLAYAIYTSGSTGKPKGVMVTHRNVLNFMAAMDRHIPNDPPGTWLAVTSLSFDISVLELIWTLCRGFKVLLQDQGNLAPTKAAVDFSLFYFSSSDSETGKDKYRLFVGWRPLCR